MPKFVYGIIAKRPMYEMIDNVNRRMAPSSLRNLCQLRSRDKVSKY